MLRLQNLTVKDIVKNINLEVGDREVVALIGPNGAGKTTITKAILGIIPYKGEIWLGESLLNGKSLSERAKLGIRIAWQHPPTYEDILVRDYVLLGTTKTEGDAIEVFELLGLSDDYLYRKMDNRLSGGERKRIELAGVLLAEPALAILDEPDSGIDALSLERIAAAIDALKKTSGVLLITHSELLLKRADRAYLLCKFGAIKKEGEPAEIFRIFKTGCESCD